MLGTTLAQDVGTFHHQTNVDQIGLGRCRKCQAKWNVWQVAARDAVQGGVGSFVAQH